MRRRPAAWAIVVVLVGVMLFPLTSFAGQVAFDNYATSAEAWGLDIRVAPIGQQIPDFTDQYYPHTRVDVDSLPHAAADGEFFDPGGTQRVGPALGNYFICNQNPQSPCYGSYPLTGDPYIAHTTSDPSSPRDVDASTTHSWTYNPAFKGLGPVTVPGAPDTTQYGFSQGSAHAHADASPYADAKGRVESIGQGMLTVGSVDGESWAKQGGGVVQAFTSTILKNTDFAGVYHVDSVTVTAAIRTSGPGTARAAQQVTYSGVKVAGVPASMDQDGLHFGSDVPITAAKQAIDQLNQALSQSSWQMVPPHATSVSNPDGSVAVSVDGGGLAFNPTNDASKGVVALISFGHAELQGRAALSRAIASVGLPPPVVQTILPPGFDEGSTITIPGTAGGSPLVNHKRLTIILEGSRHLLILPFVAVVSEIALILLIVAANRWRKVPITSPEDLLAL